MLSVATFRVDVTPPLGSPLCGGMVAPVSGVTDPLWAIGILLLGDGPPILLCAVDWCEIDNEAHLAWQAALAAALGTTVDRVSLHTVHQHNAPLVDLEAQRRLEKATDARPLMDVTHYRSCVAATAAAAGAAVRDGRPVDGAALGAAEVRGVASARRILGDDGRVRLTRWSSCRERELTDAPEGVIDPALRTVTFLDRGSPVASLHFYATHPMSYYGDGLVTADFAGHARDRRRAETPGCEHLYFNGAGGDITAGKYNEGTPESRARLAGQLHDAMVRSGSGARVLPLTGWNWRSVPLALPARPDLSIPALESCVLDATRSAGDRVNAAMRLGCLARLSTPFAASWLGLAEGCGILTLPGEPFIEYQLYAASRGTFVATAGYADTGPGYLPLARSYAEGGYEPEASSVGEGSEVMVKAAIARLLDERGRA